MEVMVGQGPPYAGVASPLVAQGRFESRIPHPPQIQAQKATSSRARRTRALNAKQKPIGWALAHRGMGACPGPSMRRREDGASVGVGVG